MPVLETLADEIDTPAKSVLTRHAPPSWSIPSRVKGTNSNGDGNGHRRKLTPKKRHAKKRHAGEWRKPFLSSLSRTANVRLSCHAAKISRETAYLHRERDEEFALAWQTAMDSACDLLEEMAWNRAKESSDLLLIFLLKAHRPAMYRETTRHEHTGAAGRPIAVTYEAEFGTSGAVDIATSLPETESVH